MVEAVEARVVERVEVVSETAAAALVQEVQEVGKGVVVALQGIQQERREASVVEEVSATEAEVRVAG